MNVGVQNGHCECLLRFRNFPRGQGLRSDPFRSKSRHFAFALLNPTKPRCVFFDIFFNVLFRNSNFHFSSGHDHAIPWLGVIQRLEQGGGARKTGGSSGVGVHASNPGNKVVRMAKHDVMSHDLGEVYLLSLAFETHLSVCFRHQQTS